MKGVKTSLLAVLLSGLVVAQVEANEFFININTTTAEPVNLTYSTTAASNTSPITAVNYGTALNYNRVVHGLILSNADTTAVTVTFSKITTSVTTIPKGKTTPQTYTVNTNPTSAVEQTVIIVPASSTVIVPFQAGLPLKRSAANTVEDLEVQLTTTGTPNVNITIDYQDSAS